MESITTNTLENNLSENDSLVNETEGVREGPHLNKDDKMQFIAHKSNEIRLPLNAINHFLKLLEKTKLNDEQKDYIKKICENKDSLFNLIGDIADISKEFLQVANDNIISMNLARHKNNQIVIIDENVTASDMIAAYCEELNMNVIHKTFSINLALELLLKQSERLDIIFIDVQMCDGQGFNFAKRVREFNRFRDIKLVALVTEPTPEITKYIEEAGFNAFLPKPFAKKYFQKVIQEILGYNRENEQIIEEPVAEKFSLKDLKVLLVDDNRVNQRFIGIILHKLGCEIDYADNGEMAIQKIQAKHYDICLMDIEMPVMDGIKATQEIRKNYNKELPIIAITGISTAEVEKKCLKSGINDYMTKPINLNKLRGKLNIWGKIAAATYQSKMDDL